MKNNIYYEIVGFTATILQYRQFDNKFNEFSDE